MLRHFLSRQILITMIVISMTLLFVLVWHTAYSYADTIVAEGNITDTVTYKLYSDGTLNIEGEGPLKKYVQWNNFNDFDGYRDQVKKIVIGEGVTEIVDASFADRKFDSEEFEWINYVFTNLERIEFPSTITKIGCNVFGNSGAYGTESLKTVTFAEGTKNLTTIDGFAFSKCTSLESIDIPESVTTIGDGAFIYCKSLETITFPAALNTVGRSPLIGCTGLKEVRFKPMTAPELNLKDNNSGQYFGLDGKENWFTNVYPEDSGCLRKIDGHDVIMRHPLGATGYEVESYAETGWHHYSANTWLILYPDGIQEVVDAIDAIDNPVTLDSEERINAARKAYDALSKSDQDMIESETLKKLTDAEEALAGLKSINNVIAMIDGIGKVTLDNEEAINTAQAAYDALRPEQREQITNYNVLLEARLALANLKLEAAKAELAQAEEDKKNAEKDKKAMEEKVQKAEQELQDLKDEIATKALKVSGLKVTSKAKKFTVKWKKNSKAEGYQVQYKLKSAKTFKNLKKTTTKVSVKSKKLKKGKKYQFRVRPYKTINGNKIYGKWTAIKTVTCK